MTTKQQQIVDLVAEGYSVEAIACCIGVSTNAVRLTLSRLGISTVAVPPGHVTIHDAARRVRMDDYELYRGMARGDLKHVKCVSRYYVTMEWVDIWMNNAPYRVQAREMVRRLFGDSGAGSGPMTRKCWNRDARGRFVRVSP